MDDPATTLKDAAYVAIGLGVITFQRAQVRRRELEKQFEAQSEAIRPQMARFASEFEKLVDPALDDVEGRLPAAAQDLLRQARAAARDVRSRLAS